MNCKPGDLAFIVHSIAGNEGRIVRVLGPRKPYGAAACGYGDHHFLWWVQSCGGPLTGALGTVNSEFNFPDSWLRPIRPGDLEDETPTVRELEAA